MPEPTHLPRADEAWIDPRKLKDYALCPDHETGKDKARVFRSALDIGKEDWEYLRDQILERLPTSPVMEIRPEPWGAQYGVRIMVDGLNGATHPVVTGWGVKEGERPWLTTIYVELP